MFQGIILKNGDILVSSNVEKIVPEDYNDPDIEISNPFSLSLSITKSIVMNPYMGDYTEQKVFSFRSDDILTMFSPRSNIEDEYKKLTGVEEQLELNIDVNGDVKWNFILM